MPVEVATAYVTLLPKTSGFSSAISKETSSSGSKAGLEFGSKFGGALTTKAVAVGNIISGVASKAFSAVAGSLDSAISRVDALNQFPKTMGNLGYSADDASSAISRMSDGIEGLPTTLDEIVANTQMLALSMGDLDKATDVALAMNDGLITFGASSYQATNAITQLNQMMTAGKYDMQSWMSVNSAAPGLLDTIAQSMLGASATAADLRDALNSGEVTTEQFTEQLVKLDKDGADGITAFSDSAKTATGGIATSMANMRTAITKNLANVIDAFNGEEGNISGVFDLGKRAINDFGKAIKPVAETAGKAFGNIVGNLGDMYEKLKESDILETLSPVIETLGFHMQNLSARVEPVKEAFGELVDGIADNAPTIEGVVNPIIDGIGGIAASVMNVIPSVIDTFGVVTEKLSPLGDAFGRIREAAEPVVLRIAPLLASVFRVVAPIIATVASAIGEAAATIAETLSPVVSDIIDKIQEYLIPVIEFLAPIVEDVAGSVVDQVSAIADGFSIAWEVISGAIDGIADNVATVVDAFTQIYDAISGPIEDAKNAVGDAIDSIKGFFDFSISWPSIPMPHFSISPSGWKIGDLLKGSIPSLSVSFYANGGIVDSPTAINVAGEAGAEAIIPLSGKRKMMPFAKLLGEQIEGSGPTNIYIDGAKVNEDKAIEDAFVGFMREIVRVGAM